MIRWRSFEWNIIKLNAGNYFWSTEFFWIKLTDMSKMLKRFLTSFYKKLIYHSVKSICDPSVASHKSDFFHSLFCIHVNACIDLIINTEKERPWWCVKCRPNLWLSLFSAYLIKQISHWNINLLNKYQSCKIYINKCRWTWFLFSSLLVPTNNNFSHLIFHPFSFFVLSHSDPIYKMLFICGYLSIFSSVKKMQLEI